MTSNYEKHIREIDNLREQCETCKLYKPDNKHHGCEVRWKLVNQDNPVAWKNKHLFMHNNMCKMYKARVR